MRMAGVVVETDEGNAPRPNDVRWRQHITDSAGR